MILYFYISISYSETMRDIRHCLFSLFQDLDSLSFQAQIMLEDIPKFHYGDFTVTKRRRFLITVEFVSDRLVNTLQIFLGNKKLSASNILSICQSEICGGKQDFDLPDITCTLMLIREKIPHIILSIQNMSITSNEDFVYTRRSENYIKVLLTDVNMMLDCSESEYYHDNCLYSK